MKKLLSFLKDRGHKVGEFWLRECRPGCAHNVVTHNVVKCSECGYAFYTDEYEICFGESPDVRWQRYDNIENSNLTCNDIITRDILK